MRYALVAVAISLGAFLVQNDYVLLIGQNILLLAIAAIGLNILFGLSGQLSLGHAGFMALGAYGSGLVVLKLKLPIFVGILSGVGLASLAGVALGLIALRAKSHYLAMVTLAFGVIVEILAQRWISVTGGSMGLIGVPHLNYGDPVNGARWMLITCGILWVVLQAFNDGVFSSRVGWVLRAMKESDASAIAVGVDVRVWRAATFVAAAALAGLAGALFAHQSGYLSSDAFGLEKSVSLLIAVVVGGLGLRYGAILGACFVIALEQAIASQFQIGGFFYGAALLGVMLFFPSGIAGVMDRIARAFRRRLSELAEQAPWKFDEPAAPADGFLIETAGLAKAYDGVLALQDVNLRVRTGTVHAVIGPNGAGKSTLVNILSGMDQPTAGTVSMLGRDVTNCPAHERVRLGLARTFQNLQLATELTVTENVLLGMGATRGAAATGGGKLEEQRVRARSLLGFVGIADLADVPAGNLSYGHRKLCELARAIAQSPTLLLLDEPIAGLNDQESARVAQIIRALRQQGVTIILVEHNMPFVMGLSDRVTVLDYGRQIAEGSPKDVQNNPKVVEAYLGQDHVETVTC